MLGDTSEHYVCCAHTLAPVAPTPCSKTQGLRGQWLLSSNQNQQQQRQDAAIVDQVLVVVEDLPAKSSVQPVGGVRPPGWSDGATNIPSRWGMALAPPKPARSAKPP